MTQTTAKMTFQMIFHVASRRIDAYGTLSNCKNAEIALDTDESDPPAHFPPGSVAVMPENLVA